MDIVRTVREAEAAVSKLMERTRGEALQGMWSQTPVQISG
jgi:hypothetical protein